VLDDILKSLKSKKIINSYSFWGVTKPKQVRVLLGKIQREYYVDISFNIVNTNQCLDLIIEKCSSSKISLVFNETTKAKLLSFLKGQLEIRIKGVLLEESFAEVLNAMLADKSIDSFRKSNLKEDRNEDFDWLIIKNGQSFKVNIVSSVKSVIYGKKPGVIYFDLKNSNNPKKEIKKILKESLKNSY
jgi:hypothetical protein